MATSPQPGLQLFSLVRAWLNSEPGWCPPEEFHSCLWTLAHRHGLDGMIGALAARGGEVPDAFRTKALEVYCTNSLRFQQARTQCMAIRNAAEEASIPFSIVKGPALAPAYADDGIRGFGDIDVLVPDGDAGRKLAELCGLKVVCGEQDIPGSIKERAQNIGRVHAAGLHFEVEFTEGTEPANGPLYDLYRNWQSHFLLPPGSGDFFPVPKPHAHLVFLLQHVALHWLNRLIWLVDLSVVMRAGNFDADWLEYAAEKMEMRKLLRATTLFCRRHFDETLPELGRGPVGWKDGLYLSMLAPESFNRMILCKYQGKFINRLTDGFQVALQHVLVTDYEYPSISKCHKAPCWTVAKLQYLLAPSGPRLGVILVMASPLLFVWMLLLVCPVFWRTPAGFAREARRQLKGSGLDLSEETTKNRLQSSWQKKQ